MRRAFVLLAVVVLVGSGLFVGGSLASIPTEEYCGICGGDLDYEQKEYEEDFFAKHGVSPNILSSSLTIQIHENGTSTWTERATLQADTASLLASNPDIHKKVVADSWGDHTVISNPDTRIDVVNETLVVSYRVQDGTTAGVGDVVLFDFFRDELGPNRMVADRIVVHPPAGMAVTNEIPAATVRNGSAVWASGTGPGPDTYVAYAPAGSDAGLETSVSIAIDLASRTFDRAMPLAGTIAFLWVLVGFGLTLTVGSRQRIMIPWSGAKQGDKDSREGTKETLSGASARPTILLGWAFLLAIPIVLLVGYGSFIWFFAIGAAPAFWVSLGMARTSRAWWSSICGLALAPVLTLLSLAWTIFGSGLGVFIYGVVPGLLWIPVGIPLFWFGRSRTPDSSPPVDTGS